MIPSRGPRDLSRRDFLKTAAAAWPILPPLFHGDPYRPLRAAAPRPGRAVRVRGRVHAAGRALAGVSVSDGLTVVATDPDGRYELVADPARRFVRVTVPSGYALPTNPSGTARCYAPIRPGPGGEMTASFGLDRLPADDAEHAFLLLADIQTQNPDDMGRFQREGVPDVKRTLARLGDLPVFGVGDGDIMWDELALYDDYERAVAELGVPFVQVVGNHDLDLDERSDDGSITTFERRFGPGYWSFERGEVHYVVLDDVFYYGGGYIGYVTDEQLAWLGNDLARVEPGRTVVVFTHIPVYADLWARQGESGPRLSGVVVNRQALYRLLEPFRAHVLTGHLHESALITEGGVRERNHGAVCGAWWTGDICHDGAPNGYGIYTVRGADVDWQYQATGRPLEHQMRLYGRGADPSAPDEMIANVWAWEPGWTVVWYQGGDRRGAMARRNGRDPRSVELHAGDRKPAGREWVDPVVTGHLFYAPVSADAGEVRVEATDLRGRRYTEVLRPGG